MPEPPPPRHRGSRTVTRQPNLVRSITTISDAVGTAAARVRPDLLTFTTADYTLGYPADAAEMANVATSRMYRSGHVLYADVSAGLGEESVVAARLAVPDLDLYGDTVTTDAGGMFADFRLRLDLPAAWQMGADYRIYVQAYRVSGSDATTIRVLRAWQR